MRRNSSLICISWFATTLGVVACDSPDAGPPPSPGEQTAVQQWISANAGGTIELDSRLTLFIPPGSLAQDTLIGVERADAADIVAMDGFSPMGNGFRLSPEGIRFRLDAPAILRLRYDSHDVAESGVHPRTLQLYYFDERRGRHVNVTTSVDTEQQTISAQLEQLALYLPMGQALIPGNNAPSVSLQNPVPSPVRAGAPIYLRASARDYDLGGALAGVKLCHRRLQPAPGAYECAEMSKETRDNASSIYGLLLGASTVTAADLGPGDDFEYYVEVTDNLGAVTASPPTALDVTQTYVSGSLYMSPAAVNMTAGSIRIFATYGVDDLGTVFPIIPEDQTMSADIGVFLRKEANGLAFQASTAASATLTVGMGIEQASATVNVFNGQLSSLRILDALGLPMDGTFAVGEATTYQFNAIGYDDWGNIIPVLPTWSSSPEVGQPITQDGLLDTTDGAGFGTVSVALGALDVTQWLRIIPLRWVLQGEAVTDNSWSFSIAADAGATYVAWTTWGGDDTCPLSVKRWDGATWTELGGIVNPGGCAYAPQLASCDGTPYLAWTEYHDFDNLFGGPRANPQTLVATWNGSAWTMVGDPLDTQSESGGAIKIPALACAGATPYAAWREHGQIFVKRWNGSAWAQDGGSVNVTTSPAPSNPLLAVVGATPFVSFRQSDGVAWQTHVKRWDGNAWVPVGGSLNDDPLKDSYGRLVACGDTPWVFMINGDTDSYTPIFAKYWDGAAWIQASEPIPYDPALTLYGLSGVCAKGRPYVTWSVGRDEPSRFHVYVHHWNGSAWVQTQEAVNITDWGPDWGPQLAASPTGVSVAWAESINPWSGTHLVVKSLQPCDSGCGEEMVCGNGVIDVFEVCDDGEANSYNGDCLPEVCAPAYCGDGYIDMMGPDVEECDGDGMGTGGESATCDYNCTWATCGDGEPNGTAGEACDDGDTIDDGNGCSATCTQNNVCGNGVVEWMFESCDDGNTSDGDGCSANCQSECGNGVVNPPAEECDDGGESATCDYNCTWASCGDGVYNGTAGEACDDGDTIDDGSGCSATCTQNNVCGNGVVEWMFESCDDGNTSDGDGCSAECQSECGNGVVNPPAEECDDGGESATCDYDCTWASCGDGFYNSAAGEACDDGDAIDDGNGCSATCTQNNVCGNGIVEWMFESCDDGNTSDGDGCSAECLME